MKLNPKNTAWFVSFIFFAGCTNSDSGIQVNSQHFKSKSTTVAASKEVSTISISSGNNQKTLAGTSFSSPLTVVVKDSSNLAIEGVTVQWATVSGGSFSVTSSVTDVNGKASTIYTPSTVAGVKSVNASVSKGFLTVSFTETVRPATPSYFNIVAGDNQVSTAGTQLLQPFVVEAGPDIYGNISSGVPVVWESSDGVLSNDMKPTDGNGRSSVQFTTSQTAGLSSIKAKILGTPLNVNFQATVTSLCSNLPTTNNLIPKISVGRYSGVAPLSVFFDASKTISTQSLHPFHELSYRWEFGDAAGSPVHGTKWGNGAKAGSSLRNEANGPLAAHTFETPGVYTVKLTVTDGTNTVVNNCTQITVQDPDIIFAGSATRCYSRSGQFSGCPVGATQITDLNGDFDALMASDLETGKRLLFRRGEKWTTSTVALLNKNGPWTIGAFGVGAKPVVEWSAGQAIIGFGWNGSNSFRDARVMDLVLDIGQVPLTPYLQSSVTFYGKFDQITLLRVDMPGGFLQDLLKPSLTGAWDQLTVQDSAISPLIKDGLGGFGVYLSSSRAAFMGNLIDNNSYSEHNMRVMFTDRLIISNNTFARPHSLKANLTLRGPEWYKGLGPIPAGVYAEYAYISDNKFTGIAGSTVPVNTSIDSSHEARTRNYLFENNWFTNLVGSSTALALNSSFSTIRNNIIDLSAGATGMCVSVSNSGDTQIPESNWIYNNTCYAQQSASNQLFGFRVFSGSINTVIKNNLMYAPSASMVTVVDNFQGVGTIGASGSHGNSSDSQAKTPGFNFTSIPQSDSLVSTDFMPAGGYTKNSGVVAPVQFDFFNNPNSGVWDIGAIKCSN